MFGGVLVDMLCGELRVNSADALRLIDVELFLNREMKSEVQKRIDITRFGSPVGGDERGWIVKHSVIFGMQRDDRSGLFFQRRQGITALKFSPSIDEKLARLIAVWVEHCYAFCVCASRNLCRPANSQSSNTTHAPHLGVRATQV